MDKLSDDESPWITEDGKIKEDFDEKVNIEYKTDTTTQGDFPDPSPITKKTPKKTEQDKWEEYIEAFDFFHKLKRKYDKKIENIKKSILVKNPDASIEQRKKELQKGKQRMKCLNCGKPGGTIFNTFDGLSVKCGNINEPCNLKIKLKRPTTIDIVTQLETIHNEININKQIITEYKLDLLFGLDDEEVILNEFKNEKENLEQLLLTEKEMKEYYVNKNEMVVVPLINPDTGEEIIKNDGEKIYDSRKKLLDKKLKKLNQLTSDFKRNIKLYKNENVLIGRKKILTDTLQIYKNVIMPLENEIRNLKYQIIYMDKLSQNKGGDKNKKNMPIYHFNPMKFSLDNRIIHNQDFEVIIFQK